ncbi:hypothetical protein BLNAU_7888 [Blattamonas nauphoetae]|uniref:Uncharacterized protein n=1 Tax=Blattamonas nauphoetae TaxID=2049346 RepID=A0ABQ9Y008_9EUKA|nr:hypothetical protein BLNAU_7888 [Blattamonas nauphoetae]
MDPCPDDQSNDETHQSKRPVRARKIKSFDEFTTSFSDKNPLLVKPHKLQKHNSTSRPYGRISLNDSLTNTQLQFHGSYSSSWRSTLINAPQQSIHQPQSIPPEFPLKPIYRTDFSNAGTNKIHDPSFAHLQKEESTRKQGKVPSDDYPLDESESDEDDNSDNFHVNGMENRQRKQRKILKYTQTQFDSRVPRFTQMSLQSFMPQKTPPRPVNNLDMYPPYPYDEYSEYFFRKQKVNTPPWMLRFPYKLKNPPKQPIFVPELPSDWSRDKKEGEIIKPDHAALCQASSNDRWFTPPFLIQSMVDMTQQPIDLDPASEPSAQKLVCAKEFWSYGSLEREWCGNVVFLNPPFSGVGSFVPYALSQYYKGKMRELFIIARMAPSSKWFHLVWIQKECWTMTFARRLRFWCVIGTQPTKEEHLERKRHMRMIKDQNHVLAFKDDESQSEKLLDDDESALPLSPFTPDESPIVSPSFVSDTDTKPEEPPVTIETITPILPVKRKRSVVLSTPDAVQEPVVRKRFQKNPEKHALQDTTVIRNVATSNGTMPHEICFFYFGPNPRLFAETFGKYGRITPPDDVYRQNMLRMNKFVQKEDEKLRTIETERAKKKQEEIPIDEEKNDIKTEE